MSNQYTISFVRIPFNCHSCDRDFTLTKNGEEFCDDFQCKHCGSEFIEEKATLNIPNSAAPTTTTTTRNQNQHQQRQYTNPFDAFFTQQSNQIPSFNAFFTTGTPMFNGFSFAPMGFMARNQGENQSFEDIMDYLMRNDPNTYGPEPAKKEDIDTLEKIIVTQDGQYDDCPVCQDQFEQGKEAVQLECGHHFHPDCVVPWLKMHNSCPTCRAPVGNNGQKADNEKKCHQENHQEEDGHTNMDVST